MKKERYKFTPAVYLLLKREDSYFFIRRYNTGYRDGEYTPVAGHHDGNVPLEETMVREAKEEIGIVIDLQDLRFAHVIHRMEEEERVDFYFICERWSGEITNNEPDKCDDMGWYPSNKLPPRLIPHVRKVIGAVERGEIYSTDGF